MFEITVTDFSPRRQIFGVLISLIVLISGKSQLIPIKMIISSMSKHYTKKEIVNGVIRWWFVLISQ